MSFLDVLTPTQFLGFTMFLVFLYRASHVARYYMKFVVFTIISAISATVFIPLMLRRPKDYRNALLPAWGARQISKLLGLTWEIRGKENIVQGSGCVVLINHQSALDLLVLAEIWPIMNNCTVISKKEVLYLGPFGLATWLWGTIFIDRLNVEKAQATINKTGETVRTKQARLCMFPEGTRHGGKTLLPFKKGAFHVAIASQTAIQPVVVSGYYFLDDRQKKFNSGPNIITILPAISTAGLSKNDLSDVMDRTWNVMDSTYKMTSLEAVSEALSKTPHKFHRD